jgi:hypothetical protein
MYRKERTRRGRSALIDAPRRPEAQNDHCKRPSPSRPASQQVRRRQPWTRSVSAAGSPRIRGSWLRLSSFDTLLVAGTCRGDGERDGLGARQRTCASGRRAPLELHVSRAEVDNARRRNRHRHGRTAAPRWGLCTRVQCSSRTHGGHRPRDGKTVRPVGNLVSSKLSNRPRRSLRRTYPCGARILKCAKPAELPGGRGVKGSRSNSGSIVTIVPPETETFRNGAR